MQYHRPTTITDAFDILNTDGTNVVAGATDLFPAITGPGLAGSVVDLTGIADFCGIERTDKGWRIGATTTWDTVANAALPAAFTALQQAARQIGSPQIQNSATVAGNLCNASPAADGVPPLLILNAEVEILSKTGSRCLPLSDFITGVRKTALLPGEVVSALHIPDHATKGGSAFEKLGAREYLVISICMVAARIAIRDGEIIDAAISVGSCSPVATRLSELEHHLIRKPAATPGTWETDLPDLISGALSPISDIRSDAQYRRFAARKLTATAIRRAIAAHDVGAPA